MVTLFNDVPAKRGEKLQEEKKEVKSYRTSPKIIVKLWIVPRAKGRGQKEKPKSKHTRENQVGVSTRAMQKRAARKKGGK